MSLSDNLRRLARERVPTGAGEVARSYTPTVYTNDSTLTETKAFVSPFLVRTFPGQEWSAKIHVDASLVDANASLHPVGCCWIFLNLESSLNLIPTLPMQAACHQERRA